MKKKRVKIRKAWVINPKTRVKKSRKIYSRKRNKKYIKNEWGLNEKNDKKHKAETGHT